MRFAPLSLTRPRPAHAPEGVACGNSSPEALAAPVLEMVTFRLVSGADEAGFLAAARATATLVAAQPGFCRRDLLRDAQGNWTDLVLWQDLEAAHAAARAVMADAAFAPFAAQIDMASAAMRHVPVVWQMGG